MISLHINNRPVTAAPGTNLLQAALDAGIDIPHLCYDQRLEAYLALLRRWNRSVNLVAAGDEP
ncbi:MAG: 2Fe-2S iron-sulfur cluster-binding protein, partial [Armatimonadota bacterium]